MPKFVSHGTVTAGFQKYPIATRNIVTHQHTGQDESKGYGKPWMSNNDGIVYKVYEPTADFEWAAVHMLVPDGDDWVEHIPLGHASKIVVKEGDFVHRGQLVGYEGNHGLVVSGGRRVSVLERQRGSRAGAHNHIGFRPITLVDELTSDGKSFYLHDKDGQPFKFEDKYCKIKISDARTKGWVDPMTYYPKDTAERFDLMALNSDIDHNAKQAMIYRSIASIIRSFTK